MSELLQEANRRHPMSLRRRAAKIGDRISHATIGDYQRGQHAEHPDEVTLQALADAFDLEIADVQAAANVPVGAGPYQPPPEAARLSRRQQAAITELIMSMVEQGGSDGRQPGAEKSPEGDPPAPLTFRERRRRKAIEDAQPVDRAADSNEKQSDHEEEP